MDAPVLNVRPSSGGQGGRSGRGPGACVDAAGLRPGPALRASRSRTSWARARRSRSWSSRRSTRSRCRPRSARVRRTARYVGPSRIPPLCGLSEGSPRGFRWARGGVVGKTPAAHFISLYSCSIMPMSHAPRLLFTALAGLVLVAAAGPSGGPRLRVLVSLSAELGREPLDGRLLLLVSTDGRAEPRFQISDTDASRSQQVFGIEVEGWRAGRDAVIDASILGYPLESLDQIPPGNYVAQALLHKYETFRRADGHVVKLPMDRGEGQQWNKAPGNLLSAPRQITLDPAKGAVVRITLDKVIPPIPDPPATRYVKHERIESRRLTKFWGRPMSLGAHVLLPEGFSEHPDARYSLVIFHGHFPSDFGGFREEAPDPNLPCERSERFGLDCYNRTVQ